MRLTRALITIWGVVKKSKKLVGVAINVWTVGGDVYCTILIGLALLIGHDYSTPHGHTLQFSPYDFIWRYIYT